MSVIRGLGRIPGQLQQQHIRTLEASFIAASSRFGSYNFREYFSRKVRHKFDVQLPTLIGTSQIDDQSLSRINPDINENLQKWWSDSIDELAVLERASIMNRLFEAPKLVVEGAANIRSSSVSDQDESDRLKTQGTLPDHHSSDSKTKI
ncbi:hypothetical protein MJO29_002241 [Puccinia striiformis f. sp. tritici]|uniref:Uncharacterized protein n=1 Tax=Puccinia striiformis f. sp. tritici PST-78 TaxID=1165861 RepID=A0A0L0W3D0_9BASI|nr:hypothetical protein Pst134EB_003728 [Puccinia striiformis f. sp. tritici]KAI7966493.1 hypothetical protein MJO29_002241 [Puccinia striiformis f. sp. tritici]KAI9618082.1 hypothetical protein KEM48_006869 [Puccinia striiformis f. sp. tritici PST-130]KNF05989.1 hypothetical protein PSTG_00981 [Puccinia striiformis f. sp. tritici PST-78]